MAFINVDLTQLLIDLANKEDEKSYECQLLPRNAGKTYFHLSRIANELSSIMNDIPEEYAQDMHTAWEAISRITSKMKGETK